MRFYLVLSLGIFLLCSCTSTTSTQEEETPAAPDWFSMEFVDVQTGETFTMNNFTGKVVLLETMAVWCPTCILQASYVYHLHEELGYPDDLISVSLDVDLNENADDLKEYTTEYGFDWYYAVAPLEVDRALGNLYSAQFMNPPVSPMLIIDRQGNVHLLPYGLKDTENLQKEVKPFLAQ